MAAVSSIVHDIEAPGPSARSAPPAPGEPPRGNFLVHSDGEFSTLVDDTYYKSGSRLGEKLSAFDERFECTKRPKFSFFAKSI